MTTTLLDMFTSRILPAIVIEDARVAVPIAEALLAGGIDCAEVTMRTPAALEAIRLMANETAIVVGAGTVKSERDVDAARRAGAKFAVSPGVSAAVVRSCQRAGIPILPGTVTATEVMQALELELRLLKFFPAGTSGGSAAVAALGGPFADVSFIPTGGIDLTNMGEYLDLPNVPAVGGTWLTPSAFQRVGDFAAIEALARQASASMTGHGE
jgi:2-dehydro-3-deoxyphosphogluconate aldolase/(4S)-4-hydroxy-2-oxoglutarate aldolase